MAVREVPSWIGNSYSFKPHKKVTIHPWKLQNNQKSTEENLDTTSEIIPNDDNLEDINRDNTNLLGNDIVEKKESLAAENKNNTDLAERISDDVKISQPSDNSKKESSSKVKKSVKSSNTSNTLKKEEKVKKKEWN